MSSTAADWSSVLINLCNLAVNILRLLGEEPVRRWFRQPSARPTTGSGDIEMGQRGELGEVREPPGSRLTVRLDCVDQTPTVFTAPLLLLFSPSSFSSPLRLPLPPQSLPIPPLSLPFPVPPPQTSSSPFPLPPAVVSTAIRWVQR